MMSLWDALRMNMMISYQELVRTFLINDYRQTANIYLGISDPDDWSKWEFSKRPLLNKPE